MGGDELCALGLEEVSAAIARREVSPVAVTEATLERIGRIEPRINAFVTVTAEEALAAARDAEGEIAAGRHRGPLHGVPISVKDLFRTRGVRTTAGSNVLRDHVPDRDAGVVARLREAGAVPIGKTNLLEFAYGEVHPAFGPSRNPWHPDYGTAGSSSGSAAAVAAGLGYGSIGSDTGGSIRGPAAYCGIVGLKPTYGLVSRAGGYPLSWSLDHMGPMTRSVRDAALLLDAIAGHDPADPTSARRPLPGHAAALDEPPVTLTVGVVAPEADDGVTPDTREAVEAAATTLRDLGFTVEPFRLPFPAHAARAAVAIIYAEASSSHLPWLRSNPDGYAPNTRERLEIGTLLPATVYLRALRARRAIVDAYRDLYRRFDLLLMPQSAKPSYLVDALPDAAVDEAGDRITEGLRFSCPANLSGQPAIAIPFGATADGLPIGVQLLARPFADPLLLRVAAVLEPAGRARLPAKAGSLLVV